MSKGFHAACPALLLTAFTLGIYGAGCASGQKETGGGQGQKQPYEIPQGRPAGWDGKEADLPDWVQTFIAGGEAALEKQAKYADKYVFVAWESADNVTSLERWAAYFDVSFDFPQILFNRVYKKILASLNDSTDDYGSFPETLLKRVADSSFTGAREEETRELLCKKEAPQKGDSTPEEAPQDEGLTRQYANTCLIMVVIGKEELRSQLNALMDGIPLDAKAYSRPQLAAISRLRDHFFEDF